jgi:serine/threonine protein kinase
MGERQPPPGYVFEASLSPGPLFAVDRVRRTEDGHPCVVKRVARASVEAASLLAREAEILGLLTSGAVGVAPRLIEHGRDAHGPFVVMEAVGAPVLAGRVLRADVATRAWGTLVRTLAALHEACDELGPLGIVHRDLSPSNLHVAEDGSEARVVDFALASYRDAPVTDDGAFRGTVVYAAPEVARGDRDVDARADLFSLAAAFLHAATGVAPRSGTSFAALLAAAAETPISVYDAARLAQLPAPLARALLACVAFERSERPARARGLFVLIERP